MFDQKLHDVYLGLGTNLGDKENNIHQAIKYIEERVGPLVACSALYNTKPVGFESENNFINAAIHIQTEFSYLEVLDRTKMIEIELGRRSKSINNIYSDRIIDIDLLLFDDLIIRTDNLILPHPHLHERMFVLEPLADIAEHVIHPIFDKSIKDLLLSLQKTLS